MFKCLCCGQIKTKPGDPMGPGDAKFAFLVLRAMGFKREALLTEHRENLDFTAPGFIPWLEAEPPA